MTFPGTRPAQRVHVPAPPSGLLPDPGGATPAERAHRLQLQTANAYDRYRASIPNGVDPDELKDAAGVFGYTDQALALQPALDAVRADADTAQQKVDGLVKGTKVNDETRPAADAYWRRKERLLDSIKDGTKLVAAAQALIADSDDSELPVLAEQLGDYLASRGAPVDWLNNALAQRIPGGPELQSDAILKARQLPVLHANHNSLTNAMAKDVAAPPLLDPSTVTAQPYTDGYTG